MLPQMQYRYGSSAGSASWGEPVGSTFNVKDFFNTGTNVINTVALSTGNSRNQTYISASTTNATGVVPNNSYNRYVFSNSKSVLLRFEDPQNDQNGVKAHSWVQFQGDGWYFNPDKAYEPDKWQDRKTVRSTRRLLSSAGSAATSRAAADTIL